MIYVFSFKSAVFKYFILFVLFASSLHGAEVLQKKWKENQTFSQYLVEQNIPLDLLKRIDEADTQFFSEIQSNQKFYESHDQKKGLLQVLIPINTEMQIHLYKNKGNFVFDIIPIDYEENEYFATITIEDNLYNDIVRQLHHKKLAARVARSLKNAFDGNRFQVGDEVSFLYTQKTRMGFVYGMPSVKIIRIVNKNKEHFIYIDEESQAGYADKFKMEPYTTTVREKVTRTIGGGSATQGKFALPLRHARVTSPFSLRRWHPVLKRYRPHHGVDFGAKKGTPIMAIGSGKVTFVGTMSGYGKTVKIGHGDGYESLYAHQSSIKVKQGANVKQGEIIGYVGNTGVSTGPHLHLGLYKNKTPIDPMPMMGKSVPAQQSVTRYEDVQKTLYKKVPIENADKNREELLDKLTKKTPIYVWEDFPQDLNQSSKS